MSDLEAALTTFDARKEANRSIDRKNNSSLPAGSPMYFYGQCCGAEIVVPENYGPGTETGICRDCKPLIEKGWLARFEGQWQFVQPIKP